MDEFLDRLKSRINTEGPADTVSAKMPVSCGSPDGSRKLLAGP